MQTYKLIGLIALLVGLVLSGCVAQATTTTAAPTLAEVTFTAVDYAYQGPEQIDAGLTNVTLVNEGATAHHLQLARLPEGATPEEIFGLFQENPPAALQALTFVGGPGLIDPGLRQAVLIDLLPGTYLALSFVADEAGVPYMARGMAMPFTVVAATNTADVTTPPVEAHGTAQLLDFSFVLPAAIAAGEQVWQVVNEGQEPHEIMVMQLADGKSVSDALAFLHAPTGTPPYASIGGFQAITPGQTGWLKLDLAPGNYVAICYIPGAATGELHFDMGMVQAFTVE
jgi:uncharacterized cupredoxin-like copper-binding protein